MGHELLSSEQDAYRKRGYFVRRGVLSEAELAPLREAVEAVHERIVRASDSGEAPIEWVDDKRYQQLLGSTVKWEWAEGSREIRSMEPFCQLAPRLDALIDQPRLWGPLGELLGAPALSLFSDKLNFKRPGGSPFPWHQDTPYWAFGCDDVERLVSLQVYLDDATIENGCLWMIPGSNRHGFLPKYEDRGVLGRLYTDVERIEGAPEPEPIEAPAGSIIFFHGHTVHGSQRNRTDKSRRAIVLTYQPAGHRRWRSDAERPVPGPATLGGSRP